MFFLVKQKDVYVVKSKQQPTGYLLPSTVYSNLNINEEISFSSLSDVVTSEIGYVILGYLSNIV